MGIEKRYLKKCVISMAVFLVAAILFKGIGGVQLEYKIAREEQYESNSSVGELSEGTEVRQDFITNLDSLQTVALSFTTYGKPVQGYMTIEIVDLETGSTYGVAQLNAADVPINSWHDISLPAEVDSTKGKKFSLVIKGHSPQGAAPTVYFSDVPLTENRTLYLNGQQIQGELSMVISGKHYFSYYPFYWFGVAGIAIVLIFYMSWTYGNMRKGKKNLAVTVYQIWLRYKFLIKQLVGRDFKTKYKRSVLGYVWSFLNPVLTMLVQYAVFSTLFRSDIKNFPVYLLSGTVFFGFFTEAVGQGLTAIVGNAALITKVYVPKYIYPMTRVVSSSINLVISLIPLLLLALLTGAPLNANLILLIVPICSILVFSMGMALILSTAMVFFRDTQYLWGIASLAWMYATPLFYPETILPDNMRMILQINPMYYMVKFVRSILIDGVSPEPIVYVFCLGFALVFFLIGVITFRKHQNKFVLYI